MTKEEALYKPTSDDLIIKGAKGIQDGLYNIQNGELFQYKAIGGTVRAYPIVEALSAWDGDLISRQDAIGAWDKLSKRGRTEFDQVLMTLPSADRPTGRWYDVGVSARCDQCGCKNIKPTRYCPYCGAKMKGGEDE